MRHLKVGALLLVLAAGPAFAGGLGPYIGTWSTSDVDDDTGLGVKLELDMGSVWDLEIRVSQFEELQFPENQPQFEIEVTTIDLGIAYNFSKARKVNPYLGGGVSYGLLDLGILDDPTILGRISDELGFYALGGLEYQITRVLDLFVEVYYRQLEAEIEGDDLTNFVKIPLDSSGPGANLGILLSW